MAIKRRKVLVSFDHVKSVGCTLSDTESKYWYQASNGLINSWTCKGAREKLYMALGDAGISCQDRERILRKLL